ncbi:helix-turn-helix domain-containing protein [Bosea sp. (in: a-proteobacteria)]|uniref:helix-turn-helix domain-containing protein n=1 Tax=Bosea sp. (in: a-proteobacteria) TaxID=1871050 RepID=UPI003B3AC1CE
MDARAPDLSKLPARHLPPMRAADDIELVQFHSDATFRRARHVWLTDVMRHGDAQVLAVCFALSNYLGFRSGGTAWVDQHRLAADLGCDVRTVGRRIREAVEAGWLTTQRRANSTSIYRMSRSRSVMASVELAHENRTKEFQIESERRRLARATNGSDSSAGTVRTDLPDTFGQECLNGSDTSVGLSSGISSEPDPSIRSTERLGEGEQDIGAGDEQKKMDEEVVAMLGRGDIAEGRRIANGLPEAKLAFLVRTAEHDGMTAAGPYIMEARKSVWLQR